MKTTILLLLVSVCAFGQSSSSKEKVAKDSVVNLPLTQWHELQFKALDQEIKRLQATTIEAEIQRQYSRKDDILSSFLAGKVPFDRIVPSSLQIGEKSISLTLRALPPSSITVAGQASNTAKKK